MRFRIRPHTLRPNIEVVEALDGAGRQIATITAGDDGRSIRVLSHLIQRQGVNEPVLRTHMETDIGVVEVVMEEGEGL